MYKLNQNSTSITRLSDGANIPPDPRNSDYVEVLRWVTAGNTILPVDLPTLAETKTVQNATLTTAYEAAIQLPVTYMATTFQADDASQAVLAKSLAAGKVMAGFYWIDANNAKVQMTFIEAEGLAYVMLVQGQAAFDKLFTKKTAVYAATTSAAVQAVVW